MATAASVPNCRSTSTASGRKPCAERSTARARGSVSGGGDIKQINESKSNTQPQKHLFTGFGGTKGDAAGGSISGSIDYGFSSGQIDWADINGDGLPDLITRTPDPGKFTVQLNYGYRLGRPFAWTTSAWSVQSVGVGQAIVEGADKLLGDFSSQIGVDTVRVHDSGSNSVGGSAGVTIGNFGASGGAGTIFNATRAP